MLMENDMRTENKQRRCGWRGGQHPICSALLARSDVNSPAMESTSSTANEDAFDAIFCFAVLRFCGSAVLRFCGSAVLVVISDLALAVGAAAWGSIKQNGPREA